MRWNVPLVAGVGFAALVCVPSTIWAQVAPPLGTAAQFGALGNSGVTGSTGAGTIVNGDVGSSPTATITNFNPPSTTVAPFIVHTTNDAIVQQAHADAKTAYDALAAQGPGTPLAANLTGVTLTPGVYSFAAAADLPASTTLTLNGPGVFVFNVGSTLTMNVGSVVAGTADPCNIYWRVGTSATLNGTSFMGTVIADASITVGGGNVSGRVLAGTGATGAVTMSSGGNTIGGCSVPPAPPTVAKAFDPASITAGGVSRLTLTLSNPNATAIDLTAPFADTLPAGVLVAPMPDAATTCGGAVTATAGGSTVTLGTGSTIPAGSCTVAVNVTAAAPGSYLNTIPAGALQTTTGNNAASATATLTATCPTITLGPATLPPGRVAVPYSQQLTASGGTGPHTFTVSSGALPAGLTLTSGGLLSGTPTALGSSTVTIQATDGSGCTGSLVYTIIIAAATCPVITVGPATLPPGRVGVAFSQQLTASGGTGPYTFAVLSGALPAGLTLTPGGLLSGTPTTLGSSPVTIQATDENGCPDVIAYTIVIAAAVPTLPQVFVVLLAVGLTAVGYSRLRRRARAV
ncbi:MAG TPA: ice-binding family protein [Vicinamibacterales bacterium]|nr:ice-binding family protein [Vicinamibacterales bacterium]